MSKVNFFTTLASYLDDKENINLTIQKTGEDLTVLLVPKIKGKTTTITMSGTAEELDEEFFNEFSKPFDKINGLVSNADEAVIEEVEEEEQEDGDDKKDAPAGKKAATKKAATKKAATKKAATKEEDKPKVEKAVAQPGIENPEEKTTEEIEREIEKERKEKEDAEKLKAENLAKEQAAKNKEEFDGFMKTGDAAFQDRKFLKAERNYKSAVELFPENEKAKAELHKASRWVTQLRDANLLKSQEEEEGGNDGANS